MGLENIGKADASRIMRALTDGKISEQEMKDLGLTAEEAKALEEGLNGANKSAKINDMYSVKWDTDKKMLYLTETKVKKGGNKKESKSMLEKLGVAAAIGAGITGACTLLGGAIGFFAGGVGAPAGAFSGFKVGLGISALLGLGSCTKDEPDVTVVKDDNPYNITVNSNVQTITTLNLNQSMSGEQAMGAILEEIRKLNLQVGTLVQLTSDQAKILQQILVNQIKNGAKLDDIIALAQGNNNLLNVIIQAVTENNTQLKNMNEQLAKQGVDIKVIANTLVAMKAMMEKYPDIAKVITDNQETIINLMKFYGDSFSAVLKSIYEEIGKLGDQSKGYFKQILNQLIANGAKIDDLKALLQQIDTHVQQVDSDVRENGKITKDMGNRILAAIAALGVDVSKGFAKLLEQGEKGIQLLEQILDAIQNLDIKGGSLGDEALTKILNALSTNNASLDDIKKLLQTINNNVVSGNKALQELGEKILAALSKLEAGQVKYFNLLLDAINANGDKQKDYTALLQGILKKLDNIAAGQKEGFDKSLAKMDEILQEIKDHDVHVTVDVTGKVTCTCNCNCGQPHEGILDDITNLIS